MISIIRTKDKIVSWKWAFAVLPIVLYSLSNRQSMPYFEERHNVIANFWDYILMSINDVYLLSFYIFPLIIFVSTVYINRTFDYTKLIRLGSYKKWIFTKLRQLFKIDIFFLTIILGSLLLTSINTPFSMEWSDVGKINTSGNEILYYLQNYFSKPYIALMLQIGLFLLTTIVFQLVLCILYAGFKKTSLLHLINGLLYLYGAISFKAFPSSMKLFMSPNYLSLFHGTASFDSVVMPFAIMLSTLLILAFVANNIDRNYGHIKNHILRHFSILTYGFLCFIGIWFNTGNYVNMGLSIWEIFVVNFIGTTNETFSLLSFAYYVIVFIGFVYFVQLLLQKYLSEMSFYTMIRYEAMNRWFFSWFPKILKSIIMLLLSLFSVTVSIAVIKGYFFNVEENLFQIIYQFMINGFLQLLFYVIFVVIVSLFTKDVLKSFIALLVLTIFMLPGFRINNLIPVGLNSMGYILEDTSIFLISAKLIVYIAIESIALLYLLNKKDYIF